MATNTTFHVRVHNIQARELHIGDTPSSSLSPYIKCNFDNFKNFKTETARKGNTHQWSLDIVFFYDTRYPDKLSQKNFTIECFSSRLLGSDDFIGSCAIDLHTLASGPVHHDILLRDGPKPSGRVSFDVMMEQYAEITATLKDVEVREISENIVEISHNETYLAYHYAGGEKADTKEAKSSKCVPSMSPSWPEMEQLYMQATLRGLLSGGVSVQFKQSKALGSDVVLGAAMINMAGFIQHPHAHPHTHTYMGPFTEPLVVSRNGRSVAIGKLTGTLVLKNVPGMAQMTGGVHCELGVKGGKALLEGLPAPAQSMPEDAAVPGMTPFHQTIGLEISNDRGLGSDWTDLGEAPPKAQPLPAGWEEKTDDKGRSFYIDHNTQTTHWNRPAPPTPAPVPIPAAAPISAPPAQAPMRAVDPSSLPPAPLTHVPPAPQAPHPTNYPGQPPSSTYPGAAVRAPAPAPVPSPYPAPVPAGYAPYPGAVVSPYGQPYAQMSTIPGAPAPLYGYAPAPAAIYIDSHHGHHHHHGHHGHHGGHGSIFGHHKHHHHGHHHHH